MSYHVLSRSLVSLHLPLCVLRQSLAATAGTGTVRAAAAAGAGQQHCRVPQPAGPRTDVSFGICFPFVLVPLGVMTKSAQWTSALMVARKWGPRSEWHEWVRM